VVVGAAAVVVLVPGEGGADCPHAGMAERVQATMLATQSRER